MIAIPERFYDILRTKRTTLLIGGGILLSSIFILIALNRKGKPENAMPDQMAMVVDMESWAVVSRGILESADKYSHWNTWQADIFKNMWTDAGLLTSVFKQERDLMKNIAGGRMLVGFSLLPSDSLHGLFLVPLHKKWQIRDLLDSRKGELKFLESSFRGNAIFTIETRTGARLVVAQTGKLLIASRFSYLVEDALAQCENGDSWWASQKFTRLRSGDAPLQWFFRTEKLAEHLQPIWAAPWRRILDGLNDKIPSLCLRWDSTVVTGTVFTGAGLPAAGKSEPDRLYGILPDNLAFLAWAPVPGRAWLGLMTSGEGETADFNHYILPWMDKDAAFVLTEPLSDELSGDACWVFSVRDSTRANALLADYGAEVGLLKQYDYQTFTIRQFLRNNLLTPLLGPETKFRSPACTLIGEYAVFAASPSVLETWVDKYLVSQTLPSRADFQLLRAQMPGKSSGIVLSNCAYSDAFAGTLWLPEVYERRGADLERLAGAGWLAIDFDPGNAGIWKFKIYSQPAQQSDFASSSLWKTPLQQAAASAPQLVHSADSTPYVLVQDIGNQLYCLDIAGNILWRRQMDGRILSTISNIDFYKNKQVNFIFNTAGHVWLLDEKGDDMPGYPLRLQSPAVNGLCLVDFDGNRNYNYFLSCANGNLYGYDQHSRPLAGWNPRNGVGESYFPLLHLQGGGKDYLIALNRAGRLFAFARNGSLRFDPVQLEGRFESGPQGEATGKAIRVACGNTGGTVFVLNENGIVNPFQGPSGQTKTKFMLLKQPEGKRAGFAWLNNQSLQLSSYKGAQFVTRYKRRFDAVQDTLFPAADGFIGTLERKRRRINRIDQNGKQYPGFPLAGSTAYVCETLETGQKILLVGNGSNVYAYKIR